MPDRIRILFLVDSIPAAAAPEGLLSDRLPLHLDPRVFSVQLAIVHPVDPAATAPAFPGPVHTLSLAPSSWRSNPFHRLSIRRLLRRLRPDGLCTVGVSSRLLGLPAGRALSIRLRPAIVDDMGEELTPALVTALRSANRDATGVIVDSYAATRRLMRQEKVDRTRIDIIPAGVDCAQFPMRTAESVMEAKHRLGLSWQQPVIVMASPFDHHQNHPLFLTAAAQLVRHQPHARFVLIGAGTHAEVVTVKREIQRRHLSEHVLLLHALDVLPLWLQAADVGVLTSYVESSARTLLLYMASGLPIVAVNAGGNSELIGHGNSGYLADVSDADQLAMYIMVLLLSPEQSARFGEAARQRAETEFPLERTHRAYDDYFRTLAYAFLVR